MPVPCVATPGVSSRSYRVEKRHAAADSAPNGTRYDPTAHAGGGGAVQRDCGTLISRRVRGVPRKEHRGARHRRRCPSELGSPGTSEASPCLPSRLLDEDVSLLVLSVKTARSCLSEIGPRFSSVRFLPHGRDRIWHLGARLARATRRSSREPGERRETVSSVGRLRATCRLERVERMERAVVWWLYPTGDDQARGTTGERGRRAVRNGHVATGAV
ncbi:unnamed protein product [Lampetra planeri]